MKSLKLSVIAVIIAITAVSIANADGFTAKPPAKKIISLTLQQAMQNPDLVIAIYQQIDPSFLLNNQPFYTKTVSFHNYLVRITGTQQEWLLFFRLKPNWE